MTEQFAEMGDWVGRTESRTDVISAWPAEALAATLDRKDPAPLPGDPLPAGWHWMFFLEAKPMSELGSDGHPQRGGFLPPIALPRRMWAGGRLEFQRPLRIGDTVSKRSTILKVESKSGKSGSLVFVTVKHEYFTGDVLAISEEQDIVYRDAAKPGDPQPKPSAAPAEAAWQRRVDADPVLLFRYSALTFNGHRIHYDRNYATGAEHYPGLVVHGPLQSTLLLDLCRRHEPRPVKRFEYRASSPLYAGETLSVNGVPGPEAGQVELWTASQGGAYAMRATARF
jgi:3-methylfumaryl-CoA hydratase